MLTEDHDTHCPLHGTPLQDEAVPIVYGLIRQPDAYRQAQTAQFPKSCFIVLGGCLVQDLQWHKIMYCPDCRLRHIAWCAEQGCDSGLPLSDAQIRRNIRWGLGGGALPADLAREFDGLLAAFKATTAAKTFKLMHPDIDTERVFKYLCYWRSKTTYDKAVLSLAAQLSTASAAKLLRLANLDEPLQS